MHLVCTLQERSDGWALPFCLCKLDVKKAYDSVPWPTLHWMFARRGLLEWPQGAYSDSCFFVRVTILSNSGGLHHGGGAQGARESPLLYACFMEDLFSLAEDKLACGQQPAGLPARPAQVDMEPEVVATTTTEIRYSPSCMT